MVSNRRDMPTERLLARPILARNSRQAHRPVAGNASRHNADDSQELNYPTICRAIRDSGFTGYVAQEFFPRDPASDAAAEALRQAVLTCDV